MPEQDTSDRASLSTGLPVEPLTRRERDVLALLAQGYSGPEIAQQLTVGLSSVKSHIQHLYGKLGANSKRQAVARARELGLLQPGPDLPAAAALTLAAARPVARNNLPLQLTSFIGREHEISEARRLLRSARLLTLTGPGGTGKTRLSLQVATEMLAEFPDGAWLVELAPISQPALVLQAVAQTLALRAEAGRPLQQVLADHLRDKTELLILDNCEHLVEACAQLVELLLRGAPGLRILANSREVLGIAGESSYSVPSLSIPDLRHLPLLETLSQFEAVRLFMERAAAVRPAFALTEGNAQAVAQICQRLDGIPLAIELAAARVRALSVEQIAARLDDRFGLLTGGGRTAAPRQQTLRATMDWSYELLSEAERLLLRRLSVFAGGWTLEAAEAACAAEQGSGGEEVLDLLTQLVSKSLVLSEQKPGQETHFRMLETIREYAREKLAQAGEAEAAQRRHLAYYLELAEAAEPELRGRAQLTWLNRLDRENDNLRAALSWALEIEAAASALRLAGALQEFWDIRGYQPEGCRWLEAALSLPDISGSLRRSAWRAKALLGVGVLAEGSQQAMAQSRLEESLSIYRELDDTAGAALTLTRMGYWHQPPSDSAKVLQQLEEALGLWTSVEDSWGIGKCLSVVGYVLDYFGDHTKALEAYQRSALILRDQGDRSALMQALEFLGWCSWLDGDAARARVFLDETLAAYEELGNHLGIYAILHHLIFISAAQGNYTQARAAALSIQQKAHTSREIASGGVRVGQVEYFQCHFAEARSHFEASLKIFRELNDQNGMGWVPPWLGCLAYRAGELDKARALIEEGLAIDDPNGHWPELAFALLSLGDVTRAQGEFEFAAEQYARSLRMVIAHGVRPDVAQYLEGFAKLAIAAGQPDRAARLLGAAAALRDQIGTPVPPVERAEYDRAVALARVQLDPASFSVAWDEGLALSWEQAANYALET